MHIFCPFLLKVKRHMNLIIYGEVQKEIINISYPTISNKSREQTNILKYFKCKWKCLNQVYINLARFFKFMSESTIFKKEINGCLHIYKTKMVRDGRLGPSWRLFEKCAFFKHSFSRYSFLSLYIFDKYSYRGLYLFCYQNFSKYPQTVKCMHYI